MSEPLPEAGVGQGAEAGARAVLLAEARDAVVLGPGIGQHEAARNLALELIRRCTRPLVVDADGLNALAAARDAKTGSLPGLPRRPPTILTPHPGEMARLLGRTTVEVQRARVESARALARITGAVVVLKGQRSVVAAPDGEAFVCPTGNAGMATAGTGDVLAGIVGALLARGAEVSLAATAGTFLHGLAGDLAAMARGPESLLAGDVSEALADAIRALQRRAGTAEVPHS
jgi:ADP-dependent NAD(P)H-hydrate dehydratase / NAD(P)H-hydrate epimerase